MKLLLSSVALSTLIFAASPAFADDGAGDGADKDTTPVIIVTARTQADQAEARVERTPGGADVVPYADYADKSLVSLRDALAFSPGVYLQPRFGQEVRISIRGSGLSRGFHMRGLTLLQDGVPINLADDNGDFQELEPIFFDHLEVYRGANALRYGSGTLGGAVNGVTPTGHSASGLYARIDGGSFDTARVLLTAGGVSGPGDFWVGLSGDTSDGDRDHARRRSFRANGNVGLELAPGLVNRAYVSVNTLYQQLPGALTRSTALTSPKTGNFKGDQQRDITSIRLQDRLTLDRGDVHAEAGVFLNAKSLYHPIFEVVDQESLDSGAYARLDYTQSAFEFTLGGEYRYGTVASKRFVNVNGRRGAKTFDADQRARTANVYGEARFRPIAPLTLIAGVIVEDGFRNQHLNYAYAPANADGRADYTEVSPKFGLLLAPREGVQFYANYSRYAEFPGFIELAQISTFVNLAPQRAWTAEVGTRGHLGIADWDVSLYRADLNGELLQYAVNSTIPASTFNAGRTRHQGVEAALTLTPAPWLRLRQSWLYSDFRFRGDVQWGNNRLPVVPQNLLRSEVRLGSAALHIAPNLEWVPQGPYPDYANSKRTPGYTLLGLSAGAQVSHHFDLFLDIRNITAKKAIGDISATLTATSGSAIYYPVEGRAVFGGIRARF